MAKAPSDLTSKTWNKLKGVTVPKTGFGAVLDAYTAARQKTQALPTRNLASFKAAADALHAVTAAIPGTLAKCNKTLHKDTIESLALYKKLIDKEGQDLHKDFVTYQGYVDKYKEMRVVCGKELTVLAKQMTTYGQAAVAAVKLALAKGDLKGAAESAKDGVEALAKIQTQADQSLAKPRVPGPAAETPHADDRPDASVFTGLINQQQDIIADRKNFESAIAKLIKEAAEKKSK